MYESLNETVTHAVEGTLLIALGASFIWGIMSVILSPCHLPSIPLVVGFVSGQASSNTRKAFGLSSIFAAGVLVTIALIGFITAAAGKMIGDLSLGPYPSYFVAGVFFLVGLNLLDIVDIPWFGTSGVKFQRKGFFAAFVLGLVFGLVVGPCTFTFMIPVLAVTLLKPGTNMAFSVFLLLAYGIGHCATITLAGTSASLVQRFMNWSEDTGAATAVRKFCGVLILVGGIILIYRA